MRFSSGHRRAKYEVGSRRLVMHRMLACSVALVMLALMAVIPGANSILAPQEAQAAVTMGNEADYTVTPTGRPSSYDDPDKNHTPISTWQDLGSGYYYTIAVNASEYSSDGQPLAAYITVFDENGTQVGSTHRFDLNNPASTVKTTTLPAGTGTINIGYATSPYYAGHAVVSMTATGKKKLKYIWDYELPNVAGSPDVQNRNKALPRWTEHTTYFYERGTTTQVRTPIVQHGLEGYTFKTMPLDVAGYAYAEDLDPAIKDGNFEYMAIGGRAGQTYYKYRSSTTGSIWYKFVFTADGVANVSGWYIRRGGTATRPSSNGPTLPLPSNVPPVDYDFDANPDNLPVKSGDALKAAGEVPTAQEAEDYYTPLAFPRDDQRGTAQTCNGYYPFKNLANQNVLTGWTSRQTIHALIATPALPYPPCTDRSYDPGTVQNAEFPVNSSYPMVYYYDRQQFSVEKTTEDTAAEFNSATARIERTYKVTVHNLSTKEGTSPEIFDTPSAPDGFTPETLSVGDTQVQPVSPGRWRISPGEKIPANGSVTLTIKVVYSVDSSKFTYQVLNDVGRCQTGANGNPKLGFYNAVEMNDDADGTENNNACSTGKPTATMSWEKADESGTLLNGSEFTLHANGSVLKDSVAADGTLIRDCAGSSCAASAGQFIDRDGTAGKFLLQNLPVPQKADDPMPYVVETKSPEGYAKTDKQLAFAFSPTTLSYRLVSVNDAEGKKLVDNGQVFNYRQYGNISWTKVDDAHKPLSGSEWQISGGGLTSAITIQDCVADSAAECATQAAGATYFDTDNRAGYFTVRLPYGNDYTLIETKAPVGFVLPDSSDAQYKYTFNVNEENAQVTTDGFIVNQRVPVPGIPLTGGTGTDTFLIGGGIVMLLGGAAEYFRRRHGARTRGAA